MKPAPFITTVEDSRVRGLFPATGTRALLTETPDRQHERIYCLSCHHPGLYVTKGADAVIYICDQGSACGCNCSSKGELALPQVSP